MTHVETQTPASAAEDHGRQNALAWFRSIVEMVEALREANRDAINGAPTPDGNYDEANEAARERILESVLSVEVRSGWYAAGTDLSARGMAGQAAPAEFRILLTTGGPAAQLCGELNEHGEPETARLEFQDWGTPWTAIDAWDLAEHGPLRDAWKAGHLAAIESTQAYLLDFARQFYFGEG